MADKEKPFDQRQYEKDYHRENYLKVSVYLSRKYDKAIIEHLEAQKSKSSYLKTLILKDMHHDDEPEDWPE